MKPESKFWNEVRRNLPTISFTRLESWASAGVPDLLCHLENKGFFTIELKVTASKKITFSPHQIAFHTKHPTGSYILVKTPGPRSPKLYPGSAIRELVSSGPTNPPLVEGWDHIKKFFEA
jgi:hypothetical protein